MKNPFKTVGRFGLKVLDEKGLPVGHKCVPNTFNVITKTGIDTMLFSGNFTAAWYCKVGTGTSEITFEDTSLTNPLPATSSSSAPAETRATTEVDNADGTS